MPRVHVKLCLLTLYSIIVIWATLCSINNQPNCDNIAVTSVEFFTRDYETIADRIRQQRSVTNELEDMFAKLMPDLEQSHNNSDRMFMYACDKKCETEGEYEYGLVSTYLLSVLFNRRFAIRPGNECSIFTAYKPNLYDWEVKEQDDANSKIVIHAIDRENTDKTRFPNKLQLFKRDLEMTDLNQKYPSDVVYFHENNDWINEIRRHYKTYTVMPWLHILPYSDVIRLVNTGLFRLPSDTFVERLNNVLTEKVGAKQLVCFHGYVNATNVKPILSYLEYHYAGPGNRFYFSVTNNSHELSAEKVFRDRIISIDSHVVTAGKHCPAVFKTIVDEHILRVCHVLITMDTHIGSRAAHMRGNSNGLFCSSDKGVVYPCKRELLRVNFKNTDLNVL